MPISVRKKCLKVRFVEKFGDFRNISVLCACPDCSFVQLRLDK